MHSFQSPGEVCERFHNDSEVEAFFGEEQVITHTAYSTTPSPPLGVEDSLQSKIATDNPDTPEIRN